MKECHSLADVREEIDKLDDQIVELIAKRNNYIKQAARFKETVEQVKAPERIDDVIQRMRRKALELDLSPNLVADLYRMMIDEMVETEIAELRHAKDL
jgi:isochorismate pyruvate lyase